MYERFNDCARKVMQLAEQEAERLKHEYVGTEHILLALAREDTGVAVNVFRTLGLDPVTIRTEVERTARVGAAMGRVGRMPQTPGAKKAIECAIEEARNLKQLHVGTEHLLLGLLREQKGVAAHVLMNLGMKFEDMRREVLNLLGHGMSQTPKPEDRPATEREEPPAACPNCGGNPVLRILWGWKSLNDRDKQDAEAGRVILGSPYRYGVPNERTFPSRFLESPPPAWACVGCEPRWTEVHRWGLEIERVQEGKWEAVNSGEYEAAAVLHSKLTDVCERMTGLVLEILKDSHGACETSE
jgi:hypothetical protein